MDHQGSPVKSQVLSDRCRPAEEGFDGSIVQHVHRFLLSGLPNGHEGLCTYLREEHD